MAPSWEAQGQSVGSGKKAGRKFSSKGGRAPGYRLSSGCRLVIGHKKSFVLLCPIGEQFLLSSFREFIHNGYCLAHMPGSLTKLNVQKKLFFSTLLTRNEGTTDESKNRLGCYQQEQLNLPREYSVFDGSQ